MAKKTIIVNRFDGGMADDIRQQVANRCAFSSDYDIFSNPYRLTPNFALITDETIGGDTDALRDYGVRRFLLASDGDVYALGEKSGADQFPQLLYKASPPDGAWALVSNGADTEGVYSPHVFIEYQQNLIFALTSGKLRRFGTLGSSPTVQAIATLDAAPTANAIIGRGTNGQAALFVPCGRYLHRILSTWAEDIAVTLPSDVSITSLENWGNYLAIATEPATNATTGRSKMFLWDYISTDVIETIDMGLGALKVIGNIEGNLIAISNYGLTSTDFSNARGKVIIKRWNGGVPVTIREINAYSTSAHGLANFKAQKDNKLYFYAQIPQYAGDVQSSGLYAVGRKSEGYDFAVVMDTHIPSDNQCTGFAAIGNVWYIAHGANNEVHRTTTTYATTPFYDTVKFTGGDATMKKRLIGVAISSWRTGDGSHTLSYRKDHEIFQTNVTTGWTEIVSKTTDNTTRQIGNEYVTMVSLAGKNLPEFNEIQFRISTTGNTEITSLKFTYEEKDTLLGTK